MENSIEIYKEKLNSYSEIRIILFYKEPIKRKDTVIFPYPNLNFEHPKLIKPFLKERNFLKKLDKALIKQDIFHIAWALSKIGIATFVNLTCSNEYVEDSFITFPKRLSETQVSSINRLGCILQEYQNVECSKILNDDSIFPIEEIINGQTLIEYINKKHNKKLLKKERNN